MNSRYSGLFCVLFGLASFGFAASYGWPALAAPSDEPAAGHEGEADGHTEGGHAEGSHGAGGHGGGGSPLAFDPDLAIFTGVVFLLLLLVLWKFAWGPISNALDEREHRIEQHIASAEASHEQAKQMLAQYEQKLAAAQGEVRGIMEEARRDAEHTKQEILAQARNDARTERDRAVREIELATDQALKELSERSTNLAIDLAGKIVQAKLNPADHARLIDEAVASFPRGNPSNN